MKLTFQRNIFVCLRFFRILVWCLNAGLDLKGEIDITETRYLCDQHFSTNYISNQARRKMLVHTAIPEKWSGNVADEPDFTIVGSPPEKKRKMRDYPNLELVSKPQPMKFSPKSPPTVLNRRTSNRLTATSTPFQEDDESQTTDDQTEETYQIERVSAVKLKDERLSSHQTVEEILIRPQTSKRVQYIFVKPKMKPGEQVTKTPTRNQEQAEVDYPPEDMDITSTNLESSSGETVEASKPCEALEGYSEFIFDGEKFVQMPKRVFEAEKEKVRKEAERCKLLLRKLKSHLLKMDLD